jgi:hypothetical protein
MASVSSPYGLRPVNLIGSQPANMSGTREFKVAADTTAIYTGGLVVLSSAGLPSIAAATPTAIKVVATSADATAGIVGVCTGVRYRNPAAAGGQPMWGQTLPINATTAGYTDIWIQVCEDPDMVFQIQGSAALGTFNSGTSGSGWPGAVGKNAALGNFGGSATTGLSTVNLIVGTNGASLAATTTLAMRIIDVVRGTESDTYPEFLVKFNVGVHSYQNPLGV